MEDPILNRSLEESKELSARWNQFKDFCTMAMQKGESTGAAEMKFMELKSRIAMLHDGFMDTLDRDQKIGQNMMSMLQECILLRRVADYNDSEKQKFEFDWNECFMLLTEHISHLEEEKERLSHINESSHRAAQKKEQMVNSVKNFFTGAGFKLIATIAAIVVVVYVIPNFIWSYRNLYNTPAKPVYLIFTNSIWRKVSPNYEYDALADVPYDKKWKPAEVFQVQNASDMDRNYLVDNELSALGFSNAEWKKKAREAIDPETGLLQLDPLRIKPNMGEEVRLWFLFFKDSKGANDFIDLMLDARRTLPDGDQNRLRTVVTIYRSANFIALGVGNHPVRAGLPREKYKSIFNSKQENLYDVL